MLVRVTFVTLYPAINPAVLNSVPANTRVWPQTFDAFLAVTVKVAGITLKVWFTGVAAVKKALPDWSARTVIVPVPVMVIELLLSVAGPDATV